MLKPLGLIICKILGVGEEEYFEMLDKASEIARGLYYNDMIRQLKNIGLLEKD